MPAITDLLGANGVIEQLLLWNVVGEVVSAMAQPAFTALIQDAQSAHPDVALTPDILATLVARHLVTEAHGAVEAKKSGTPPTNFALLAEAAKVRLTPGDLATAVLRSYMALPAAEKEALPQGITAAQFTILADLAGDAPGPQQLAEALRRNIIKRSGRGAKSTSFDQGIAESRLHNKWADMIAELTRAVIAPADAADAAVRNYLAYGEAEKQAKLSGVEPPLFKIMTLLAGHGVSPDQAAVAVHRGAIPVHGDGPNAVSLEQALAESGVHAKWLRVVEELSRQVLSPPAAAEAVIRNFVTDRQGTELAARSGVDEKTFDIMRDLAGDAPGPQQLAEALRRGAIHEEGKGAKSTSFEQGIAEGRLADKWAPVIKILAQIWPTPVDALDAVLKGQLTLAEGKKLYEKLGGAPEFFDVLYRTEGEAPTPLELIEMANRKFIPWTGLGAETLSYQQGFKEGRWRNKWAPAFQKFAEFLPAPETIVTLLKDGTITTEAAADLFAQHGMTPDVVKAYLDEAHTLALSDYRGATVSIVLDAYYTQLIDNAQATTILGQLHVTDQAIGLLLSYTDARRVFAQVQAAVTRTRTLFVAGKITVGAARGELGRIGIPTTQIEQIIATWSVEQSINVRTLTEAQIADAFAAGFITQEQAMVELENIRYTPLDAWILLSLKAKGPLPNKPQQGPAPPIGVVTPGTT